VLSYVLNLARQISILNVVLPPRSKAAVPASDLVLGYTTTKTPPPGQTVSIEVTATDRPGHKTTKAQPTQRNA